jgi:ribosome maturation factor RimP
MLRTFMGVVLTLVVFALGALAEEYRGKIKSIDADKGTITVTVGDKDQEFKVPATAKVLRGKKEVADGIKDKRFGKAVGSEVTVVTEKKDGAETVTSIKLSKKDK